MTGLLALIVSLQMTFGPTSLAHEQELISGTANTIIMATVYLPALTLCMQAEPVARLFAEMDEQYRGLLPSDRPLFFSRGRPVYRHDIQRAR